MVAVFAAFELFNSGNEKMTEEKTVAVNANCGWSPMAVCPKCGNVGIGEEFIGAKCSCGATTVRYGTTAPSPGPPAQGYKDAVP